MKFVFIALALFNLQTTHASIRAYFNHNAQSSYVDPYKGVTRTGDNLEAVLLEQMEKAEKTLWVAVFELRLPEVAKMLVKKHKAGVDVRVIVDNGNNFDVLSGPNSTNSSENEEVTLSHELMALVDINGDGVVSRAEMRARDAIYILKSAKVPLIDDSHDGSLGSGLMHHKFVVIDGKTTVMSSANFTPSCVHGDLLTPKSQGNANAMMVVRSAGLNRIFQEEFLEMWGSPTQSSRFGSIKTYRAPRTVTVGGSKITVQFSPMSRTRQWKETTNGLIAKTLNKTKTNVQAALFVFSEQKLADVMEKLSLKDDSGVLVESRFAYRDYSEVLDILGVALHSSKCEYEPDNNPWRYPLKNAGIPTMTPGDKLHHKFAVVDQRSVIFGSHNWSEAANHINDEFLAVVENPQVAEGFSLEYQRLLSKAKVGVPERIANSIIEMDAFCQELR